MHSIIVGTGSYIPTQKVHNRDFLESSFCDADGKKSARTNEEIIKKFEAITGIMERRYVTKNLLASDIAFFAAREALESSKIDKESLDYIIVAHKFGDVRADNKRSEFVPSLAARVKHRLEIENPRTIAYDLSFGCPGWLQGMIQADYYLKAGDAQRALVIGAETLSRISDPHDRDSMIYADGAGATILEAMKSKKAVGILSHGTRSDTFEEAYMLWMDRSCNPDHRGNELYLKMNGHKLYEYALKTVPPLIKQTLEKAGLSLGDVRKVIIHQANAKMDEAILKRLYGLYGMRDVPPEVMPMIISWSGNSSVASMPTLLDLILKGKINGQSLQKGDHVVFASVGAGMNINAIVYKVP